MNKIEVISLEDIEGSISDIDIDLSDIEESMSSIEEDVTSDSSLKDTFDYKYSISPLGLNFNVLLKENVETLILVLSTVMENIEDKGRIKEFLIDAEIFKVHMQNVIEQLFKEIKEEESNNQDGDDSYIESRYELLDKAKELQMIFEINLDTLKSSLGISVDNVNIYSNVLNGMVSKNGNDNSKEISLDTLMGYETQNSIRNEIATFKNRDLTSSPVFLYYNELKSLLISVDKVNEIFYFCNQLNSAAKNSSSSGDILKILDKASKLDIKTDNKGLKTIYLDGISLESKLKNIILYGTRSYSYSELEYQAMELLHFPTELCGREEFVKPNMNNFLLDKSNRVSFLSNSADIKQRKETKARDTLTWITKAKLFINKKSNKDDMGALYF